MCVCVCVGGGGGVVGGVRGVFLWEEATVDVLLGEVISVLVLDEVGGRSYSQVLMSGKMIMESRINVRVHCL